MVYIDFQGGAHGNYLEFICNKFLANIKTTKDPFNKLGAAHKKDYVGNKEFFSGHYFESNKELFKNKKLISIKISADDLLLISSISLLRAGDYNLENNQLEIDTYNKWNNKNYQWVLDNLIKSFFQTQLTNSYNAVKDLTWPDITTTNDFKNLPAWIQDECSSRHNLELLELSPESPDCPRHILREFFKIGFKYPEQNGFMTQQQKMIYNNKNIVYNFSYASFYDTEKLIAELTQVAQIFGYTFLPDVEFYRLHNEFLSRQPYLNSKKVCDSIFEKVISGNHFEFPNLDLLQESYLTACIELYYNIELPNNNIWFKNSDDIFKFINE
jgi:hypothetical protein